MDKAFSSWSLDDIIPGEALPTGLYLYLEHRFVLFKKAGELVDRDTYDRLERKRFVHFFVHVTELPRMQAWIAGHSRRSQGDLSVGPELTRAREDAHRSVMDIFHKPHSNESVAKVVKASQNLVDEVMKYPFANAPLKQLQTYSKGTVDHSVNVSVLSVYLAVNMGYSHVLILRHLAIGALLHDVGKAFVGIEDADSPSVVETKMRNHPELGVDSLDKDESISREAKLIVEQHHECHDGSGFPRGLHGERIYDLARIVSIANVFDEHVADSKGTLEERQARALVEIEGPLASKFHPVKLQKALKILRFGI